MRLLLIALLAVAQAALGAETFLHCRVVDTSKLCAKQPSWCERLYAIDAARRTVRQVGNHGGPIREATFAIREWSDTEITATRRGLGNTPGVRSTQVVTFNRVTGGYREYGEFYDAEGNSLSEMAATEILFKERGIWGAVHDTLEHGACEAKRPAF
ncbi:MAG TPA: hypothetical protein VNU71_13340 [Burkholderiaceae bacterium]|nr:hypothetical protein [Burkholderiaceae bacterium]